MRALLAFVLGFLLATLATTVAGAVVAGVKRLEPSDWLQVYGSILGAIITIVGAYVVFHMQEQSKDRRHLKTMIAVLRELASSGLAMAAPDGPLDPATHVAEAWLAYQTSESISQQLRANGPQIAYVAEKLALAMPKHHLIRLQRTIEAGGGIAAEDLKQRGDEIHELARSLLQRLHGGL